MRTPTDQDLGRMAEEFLGLLERHDLTVVAAESCTAGLLCQVLSNAPGAAEHFHGGFVTYTKEHKCWALGVPPDVLRRKGAVCREVARAMADGALAQSSADLAVAITGVAGPEPDEDGNPVGLVCLAVARRGSLMRDLERNYGDIGRDAVRRCAVADALASLMEIVALQSAGVTAGR
jgi:nicotinamide-nucleotide amidase